jgi:hypothetical protein
MAEYWEEVYQRGLQTIGVWQTFAPAFTVGQLTLASHTTDNSGLPDKANEREVQQDALDDARIARDVNYQLMEDLSVRFPRLLEGVLDPDDPWHAELADIRDIKPDSNDRRAQRARRVVSLWTRVNAQRAAAVPPLGPLLVGTKAVADLEATLDNLAALLQAVETEDSELTEKREALKTLAKKVDKNNKRWYAAWEGNFPEGSPERNALSQIDTGSPTQQPTALEIAGVGNPSGTELLVSYTPGGGQHATMLTLQWQIVGVDAEFTHDVQAFPSGQGITTGAEIGQTVNLRTRAANSAGETLSAVVSYTFT